jgi:hypothetical protein
VGGVRFGGGEGPARHSGRPFSRCCFSRGGPLRRSPCRELQPRGRARVGERVQSARRARHAPAATRARARPRALPPGSSALCERDTAAGSGRARLYAGRALQIGEESVYVEKKSVLVGIRLRSSLGERGPVPEGLPAAAPEGSGTHARRRSPGPRRVLQCPRLHAPHRSCQAAAERGQPCARRGAGRRRGRPEFQGQTTGRACCAHSSRTGFNSCQCALTSVRGRGARYGRNPKRLAVSGPSAEAACVCDGFDRFDRHPSRGRSTQPAPSNRRPLRATSHSCGPAAFLAQNSLAFSQPMAA